MNREMTEGERELDLLAGDLIAENKQLRERVMALELALNEWWNKTEWVQETAAPMELGRHRADVLKARIEQLESEKRDLYRDLANRLDAIGHKSEIAMLISDWIRRQS